MTSRIDPKRRNVISHRKKQFAKAAYKEQEYPYRLNFYDVPPTAEITLEQFEQWAIDRLKGIIGSSVVSDLLTPKVLAELEACQFRDRSPAETSLHMTPLLKKYLPLYPNSSSPTGAQDEKLRLERQKDHYSHFILRLAFASTADLRARFTRIEAKLFRLRFLADDAAERQPFVASLNLHWQAVSVDERRALAPELASATPGLRRQEVDEGSWFKVDWESVPELVEGRRVLVKKGMAYVPGKEQMSMVLEEFKSRLEKGLELTARALPRLDEDDRLTPILNHLSKNFAMPDASLADADSVLPGSAPTAASIDGLSAHFPLCMRHLHDTLRSQHHLKNLGRLQYTLFLKGLGLSLDDCIMFWRTAFRPRTADDVFDREYRYNVRHAYGDVGGDSVRRARGYAPYSCQQVLTRQPPGPGQAHGCPYRHFSVDNLIPLLERVGVREREVLAGVRDDVARERYHIACNRVFDWAHRAEVKKAKEDGSWGPADLDVILHPNTYFKRSYRLKHGAKPEGDVPPMDGMEVS